jgi:hypothetical protein
MSRRLSPSRLPRLLIWALCAAAGAIALLPARAWAACGPTDLGACVDGAVYDAWVGVASVLWMFNRTLLALAFQLDALRSWLIEIAFAGVYQVLVDAVGPLLPSVAALAAVIGGLCYLLLPLIGRANLVNLRHVLVWVVIAPVLLTASGPLLVELDNGRVAFGSTLFAAGGEVGTLPMLGAEAGDMAAVEPLYPANPCGSGTFARSVAGLRPDDLAAALLYANARDIHCPEAVGLAAVPQRFYEEAPTGPQYAVTWKVARESDPVRRTNAIAGIQQGVSRLALGILPCLTAVLDALLQLLFSLCMVALWVSLPLGLLFIFFQQTASGVGLLFRRTISVLQVSWSCSFVTGLFFLCLTAAAQLGNAAAYSGFAIGSLIINLYLLTVAKDTLRDSIRTLNEVVLMNTGLSVTAPVEMAAAGATGAATLAAAAATGGAAIALTGAAAMAQTGNDRYAAGAMAGRIRPLYQLGEVARVMGVGDSDVLDGMYAGSRGEHSLRAMGRQMQTDARRSDDQGLTLRERATERKATAELARNERPTLLQQGVRDLQTLGAIPQQLAQGVGRAGAYTFGDGLVTDLDRAEAAVRVNWQRLRAGVAEASAQVAARAGSADPGRVAVATALVADVALSRPDHRNDAIELDDRKRRRYLPRVADDALPAYALRADGRKVAIPRLLTLGYTVQRNDDESVTFWQHGEAAAAPTGEQAQLIKAGAVRADAAVVTARAQVAQVPPGASSDIQQSVAAAEGVANQAPAAPSPEPAQRNYDAAPSAAAVAPAPAATAPTQTNPAPTGVASAQTNPAPTGVPSEQVAALGIRLDAIDASLSELRQQQETVADRLAQATDTDALPPVEGLPIEQRTELDEIERASVAGSARMTEAVEAADRAEAQRDEQERAVPLVYGELPAGVAALRAQRRLAELQARRDAVAPTAGTELRVTEAAVREAEAELAWHQLRGIRANVAFETELPTDAPALEADPRVQEARSRWEDARRRVVAAAEINPEVPRPAAEPKDDQS